MKQPPEGSSSSRALAKALIGVCACLALLAAVVQLPSLAAASRSIGQLRIKLAGTGGSAEAGSPDSSISSAAQGVNITGGGLGAAASHISHALVVPDVAGRTQRVLPDIAAAVLELERQGRGRKVIAMSLFGNSSRYVQGAVENAVLAARDWPGWTLRIYHGEGVPDSALHVARGLGAETVRVDAAAQTPRTCMYWRFFALEDRTATRVIIRDVDARLTQRDHAAVSEWVESGRLFHTLHDHQEHGTPVLGGMWGAVSGFLNPALLQAWPDSSDQQSAVWGNDQHWLADIIWPLVKNETLDHASFLCHAYGAAEWRGFPVQRRDQLDFVGNVYVASNAWQGMVVQDECPAQCRRKPEWTAC